ncbi:unnamed protein product [Rhodiola kirilowii]
MVVKMMRWRPWPPMVTRKYDVKVCVRRLEGADRACGEVGVESECVKLAVEIRWKRHRVGFSSLRRCVNRNLTKEVGLGKNDVVCWDEEFQSVCSLSGYKDNLFHPWVICFNLLNASNQGPKGRSSVLGSGSLNLAEFTDMAGCNNLDLEVPLKLISGGTETCPSLSISMRLLEIRITQESTESAQKTGIPLPSPSPPLSVQTTSVEKDELSALKAGLRKVRILTSYVSSVRTKKTCHEEDSSEGQCTTRSEDPEYTYPFDSDSWDDLEDGVYDDAQEENNVRKSFSYGTLAYANCVGSSYYSTRKASGEDEDWVYFSHRKSDVGCSVKEDSLAELCESYVLPRKRSFLPWKRRKLNLKSPKDKGEPLLKEAHREEGGDDIDFDRRQLSSDESLYLGLNKSDEDSMANGLSVSDFGDDHFSIGSWEKKDIISRDGLMKLQTQVFFASIDQRSEQAAGESACTALVAVITDWFWTNRENFPIKSQFDSLIREGSLEWRWLCKNEVYREAFPDKHFDLDTIVQAKIRPLTVVQGKSFVGFFHPEDMDEERFGFLQGAMSFDGIWDEIERAGAEMREGAAPLTYIVSWNDHFFVLKVEPEAYYIIDTLGERLYEGCNQAYILKFDRTTIIHKLALTTESSDDKPASVNKKELIALDPKGDSVEKNGPVEDQITDRTLVQGDESIKTDVEETEIVCRGKESCKEYIKSMLTAIPIRELLVDIKKGLMASVPVHQRLQIEFHYTVYLHPVTGTSLTTLTEASEAEKVETVEREVAIA